MRLSLTVAIALFLQGTFAMQNIAHAGDNPMLGEIRWFAGNFAPRGWALCEGQLLPINQNEALFSLLGTIYGGDGRNTFGLPDMRGRAHAHHGNGPGLANRTQGQKFGAENVSLSSVHLPPHSHTMNASANLATQTDPTNNLPAVTQADTIYAAADGNQVAMHPDSIGHTGNGLPHNNMQPSLGLNCIIALFGTFPSRN